MTQKITFLLTLLVTTLGLSAQSIVVVTDGTLMGNSQYRWTANNEYVLDGLVFLEAGSTLTIDPGTVIRGREQNDVTTGDNTSALIIARNARIVAEGTADEPIIFTAESDNLGDAEDLTSIDRGRWGGLIILGNGVIANNEVEDAIEGIAATELRARYGGSNNADDSGVLRYVSIRHGGAQLSPDNEINGLTLGGVGSGTVIDYIEVFANADDGIEWFGGAVVVDHAAVSFCADDSFDYDQGWRGGGQYWFSLQGPGTATGRAGEHDGATPDNAPPFSNPFIANATYIGIGNGQTATGGDADRQGRQQAVIFRDNAAGTYVNSIFADFNNQGIAIEDRDDTDANDSYARFLAGDLVLRNNLFFNFGGGTQPSNIFFAVNPDEQVLPAQSAEVVSRLTMANNRLIDPNFIDAARDEDGFSFDPRPNESGTAANNPVALTRDGFESVTYYGAFAPGLNFGNNGPSWLGEWTALTSTDIIVDMTTSNHDAEAAGYLLAAPAPNPATDECLLSFTLPRNDRVRIDIVDITGRNVTSVQRSFPAGPSTEMLDVRSLPSGTYFITLNTSGYRLIQKLVVP